MVGYEEVGAQWVLGYRRGSDIGLSGEKKSGSRVGLEVKEGGERCKRVLGFMLLAACHLFCPTSTVEWPTDITVRDQRRESANLSSVAHWHDGNLNDCGRNLNYHSGISLLPTQLQDIHP